MNKTEQGVLLLSKSRYSLVQLLLSLFLCFTQATHAETNTPGSSLSIDSIKKHQLSIIYTQNNALQKYIASTLSESLLKKHSDIKFSTINPETKKKEHANPDLIIAIGIDSIHSANKLYPEINKLFISTKPGKYRFNEALNSGNAILYMTQPYCRQIKFIKLINNRWNRISILTNQNNAVAAPAIKECAKKYGIKTHSVKTSITKYLTDDVKNALDNSDLLLALPNKDIFNEKTIKNILLTSYRHRKPVIAFSKNFVTSGALASVHSNKTQIANTAATLLEQYISNEYKFNEVINYPESYDISINRQVFKALNIKIPDINKIKKSLEFPETDNKKKI